VPVRVELGPREIAAGQVPVAFRARSEKTLHALEGLTSAIRAILESEQAELLRQATELRERLTHPVRTIDEAVEQARDGAARLPWTVLSPRGEQRLLKDGVSVRCLVRADGSPVEDPDADGVEAIVARAY
jgi:prolyl-tRNA synthetase